MALQKITKDMQIIAKLDDEPNDVGGLTAYELKAKFDEAGESIKSYLNDVLLKQLEAAGVEQAVLLPENTGGFKYIRLNGDKVLEVSADGSTWQATGSSGHLIYDKNGVQLPQRSRMKFVNSEVTDDGVYTIVQGIKGDTGADGITPTIGANGNWYIGDTDTGVSAGENAASSRESAAAAKASEDAAAGSATNAFASATSAYASATSAGESAVAAASSATAAANSATAAKASEEAANASETAAAESASAAQQSAASAQAAKAALEQSIAANPGSTVIDPTLSVAGAAAEAAAVGQLKGDLDGVTENLNKKIGFDFSGTRLTEGTDFNDLNSYGRYFCDLYDTSLTFLNAPAYRVGMLLVLELQADTRLEQIYFTEEYIYYRYKSGSGWGAWVNRKTGCVSYDSALTLTDTQKALARKNIASESIENTIAYNRYNAMEYANGKSETYNGITYTRNGSIWTISGTATANSFCNIFTNHLAFPIEISKSRKYQVKFNGGNITLRLYNYYNDGTTDFHDYSSDFIMAFPDNCKGFILRFQIPSGTDVPETTVNYEIIPADYPTTINNSYSYSNTINKTENISQNKYNITSTPSITTDTHGWLAAVDTDTADETGKTDMTSSIMTMLTETGYCHLGEGIFYVSGNIDMPPHSMIEGCGDKTTVRLLSSVTSGYVLRPTQYCTIRNLCISGGRSEPTFGDSIGSRHGISYYANADGGEAESIDALHCMVSGVYIRNFSGSGIRLHNTGLNYEHSLYMSDSFIRSCYIGINIDYYSEFNKFIGIGMYWCKIACKNNGGNNAFDSCTFHATDTGFLIDNSDGAAENNAHGLLTNGTFCHIGSNHGKAIVIKNTSNGYMFNNCQVHFCSIDVQNSNGIVFNNFEFGTGTTGQGGVISVSGGNLVMFSSCMFNNDVSKPPVITITNNTKTKFVNCYGGVSGNPITAS